MFSIIDCHDLHLYLAEINRSQQTTVTPAISCLVNILKTLSYKQVSWRSNARAAIDRRNAAMLRLLKRHLGDHLYKIGTSHFSQAPPL